MVPRETVTFVSRRGKHQDSRENKTNWFPEGPYIKCFVIYLDFPLNNHKAKFCVRATTAQLYPGRDTFEFDQEHVTSAHFVEWKSSYVKYSTGIFWNICHEECKSFCRSIFVKFKIVAQYVLHLKLVVTVRRRIFIKRPSIKGTPLIMRPTIKVPNLFSIKYCKQNHY